MNAQERIPEELLPLLNETLFSLDRDLTGLVDGFYLIGSVALAGFNPRFSDVDFVAVLSRTVTPGDWQALGRLHRALERKYSAWKLEGIYLQPAALGCKPGQPPPFPAYHDGRLEPSRASGINPVTWWILKEHGIALRGPEPAQMPFSIEWAGLLDWMHANLNSYWAAWVVQPRRLLWLLTDPGLQWAVLGVLRPFYAFREGKIATKSQAGAYALACLEDRWKPVIREALALRDGRLPLKRSQRLQRALDARELVREIIRVCNEMEGGMKGGC